MSVGLPDEVLSRLAAHNAVRLSAEGAGSVAAWAVPLHQRLYVLVRPSAEILQALEEDRAAEVTASGPAGAWNLALRGRAVPGRTAAADSRRSEMFHWLPEDTRAQDLVAVLFHPEHMDWSRANEDGTRYRAQGEIPGSRLPSVPHRYFKLCSHGVVLWPYPMAALDFFVLLMWVEERYRHGIVLTAMVLAGAMMLGAVTLAGRLALFTRWREGSGEEADAPEMVDGWLAPAPARRVALGLGVGGALLALLLGPSVSPTAAVTAILASGAPFLGGWHLGRHVLRRVDRPGQLT
jgi:hypothetical protein